MTVHGLLENRLRPRVAHGIGRCRRLGSMGRWRRVLAMLALGATAAFCTTPGARAFELSCADEPAAAAAQPESDEPIEISGTFTCAPLTSPRALDIIVASDPWFESDLFTRVYFYAYTYSNYQGRFVYKLIRLPEALQGAGEWEVPPTEESRQQYFKADFNGDCIVDDFYVFGRSAARPEAVFITIDNDWRDLPEEGVPAGPTRLKAFLLKDRGDGNYEFEEVGAKVLKKYHCRRENILPEVKAFKAEITK
jgi:hypothetical protein